MFTHRFTACAVLTLLALTGCSSTAPTVKPSAAPAHDSGSKLAEWTSCPLTETTETPPPTLECSSMLVPMDYSRPDGPTFKVPLIRIPSKSTEPRLLMTNPGGPGVSGIDDLRSGASFYEKFTGEYTVVSFDPRGIGASAPAIKCIDEQQRAAIFNQPSVPFTAEQQQHAIDLAKGIGESCNRELGEALPHVGTANVIRDMDSVRAAMGFEKMSYLGFSYGTFIGALYADAYPDRTDRWVLDSVMDPSLTYEQVRQGQAEGMQQSITAFTENCLALPACPLNGSKDHALQMISNLIDQLNAHPQTTGDGRELSGARMLALVESSMYEPISGWPALREVLSHALIGDWTSVTNAAYSPNLMVNPADSEYLSVVCIDFHTERNPAEPARLAPIWASASPLSGGNRAWSLQPCESWPVTPVRQPSPVKAIGAGPILILNMVDDPATPLRWAQSLHQQLTGSTLVIAPGQGHIASDHNACADDATQAFLAHGTLPAGPIYNCPADK